MTIWALGDPHLSFGRPKPMDVFGPLWRDHPAQIAAAWDRLVAPDDVVLVVGDVSWAHTLDEVRPDLEFLAARPGRQKFLLRGNHDSWWTSASKVRRVLPETLTIIDNDAHRLPEGAVICGARGWNLPEMPWTDPEQDPPIFRRELQRLDRTLDAAQRLRAPGDRLIAALHYPPLGPTGSDTEVLARLRAAAVDVAPYGHLHGEDHAWAPEGVHHGVLLRFVAADHTLFSPRPIWSEGHGVIAADHETS